MDSTSTTEVEACGNGATGENRAELRPMDLQSWLVLVIDIGEVNIPGQEAVENRVMDQVMELQEPQL